MGAGAHHKASVSLMRLPLPGCSPEYHVKTYNCGGASWSR